MKIDFRKEALDKCHISRIKEIHKEAIVLVTKGFIVNSTFKFYQNLLCIPLYWEKPSKLLKQLLLWSWRDSNPRPDKETMHRLHVQLPIQFLSLAWRVTLLTQGLATKVSLLFNSIIEASLSLSTLLNQFRKNEEPRNVAGEFVCLNSTH